MKLRNYPGSYSIGLDLGTASVGWDAVDEVGKLLYFNREPVWGSRLFESAEQASVVRVFRGQRRRYIRRKWRLDFLQKIFKKEMDKIDEGFFLRLNQSLVLGGDPIFNGSDFTKADYYDKFKTIYHLRAFLMETEEKADLRLIYLAMHNIVKHRGNFLRQEEKILSAKNAKADDALNAFYDALDNWCEEKGYECIRRETKKIAKELARTDIKRAGIKDEISKLIAGPLEEADLNKKFSKNVAASFLGLSTEFKDIFGEFECEKTKCSFSNEEDFGALKEACPDDCKELLDALYGVYSAYVLQGILSDPTHKADGKTISYYMISKYDKYGEDLKTLKALIKEYAKNSYKEFFRGEIYSDSTRNGASHDYDVSKAKGYTKYNLGKTAYDDFKKEIEKVLKDTGAEEDTRYIRMIEEFERQQFLRRLKTSDNGAICYQLHLEELDAIIENQSRFYPFLKEEKEKLLSLVTFRIPYYVGPLTDKNAAKDMRGNKRFQWSERKEGMEDAVITPWNWEQVIDKNISAENFIMRMTGDCTYLAGEKVLPRCSLLYEEFCVLNELNGIQYSEDGDDWHRLDTAQRKGIIDDLFKNTKTVSYKKIQDWLIREDNMANPRVKGGQGETGMVSKMDAYIFFKKDIFNVETIDESLYPIIETIIKWNTLFEDRSILKEKLESEFGPNGSNLLNKDQIKKICKKRFTGWGRLSQKLLSGLKIESSTGIRLSIMDILRDGNPFSERKQGETVVFMEAITNKDLGFNKLIEQHNNKYYEENAEAMTVNELPGSPAIRRSINQAIRIVDEIAKVAGHAPTNIFIEVTREEDEANKGNRTTTRKKKVEEALKVFKDECKKSESNNMSDDACDLLTELKSINSAELDERLTLYFMQCGKCMYSGKPLGINDLWNTGLYEVDHIIPRAYIKDDSLENKALVYRKENQRKTDNLLLESQIRKKMASTWRCLHDAKLIGDKKFNNLMRDRISDKMLEGFINRQIVETSQSIKHLQSMLKALYPETNIIPIKAGITHNLREREGLIKCREANDYHHAHDAYLACQVGLFLLKKHPTIFSNPIGYAATVKKYIREQSEEYKKTRKMPGSSGFIVDSFCRTSGYDEETGEIFENYWNGPQHIEEIKKVLDYRQCFITRMPEESTGAFWNATLYSPRDPRMGSKLNLPIKEGFDPQIYGGYSSQQFAYFFIYKALKKDKPYFQFSEVPVSVAKEIEKDPKAQTEFAKKDAEKKGLEFVQITRSKILKKQLIEIDGDRLLITGKKEVRNATEMAFTQQELSALQGLGPTESIISIIDKLTCTRSPLSKKLKEQIDIDKVAAETTHLQKEEMIDVIKNLLSLVNAQKNMVDLSPAKGYKNSGCLRLNYSKILNEEKSNLFVIDQSVTGMFERKTYVGL